MLKSVGSWCGVISLTGAVGSCLFGLPAIAVELVGRAVLPADTFSVGPTAGQFITPSNGRIPPFVNKQAVQGVSAVLPGSKPGTFLIMSDNGFGAQNNSQDALLRFYAVEPDFRTEKQGSGQVFPISLTSGQRLSSFSEESFFQLSDRRRRAGFAIVAEQTNYPGSTIPVDASIQKGRFLTGADFDLESFRRVGGSYWFGEEFGPFLLEVSESGELRRQPIPLPNLLTLGNDPLVRSPQSPILGGRTPNLPGSRGFEGMALNASGTFLYPMLEGALIPDSNQSRRLIYEFDVKQKVFTGRVFFYRVEDPANAIGDFTAINDTEFIVIERDNNQGDPNNPAFTNPAKFKRLYKIDITQLDANGFAQKELIADLLNIRDPKNLGGNGTVNGRFTFPFVTIESVLPIDPQTLLVINDNNYPFSVGRTPGQPDNTEFILIKLDQPLKLDPRLILPTARRPEGKQ